jgi:shikimate kinase
MQTMSLADCITEVSDVSSDVLFVLMGPGGVGKDYVAERMAVQLNCKWLDLDRFGLYARFDGEEGWFVDQALMNDFLKKDDDIGIVTLNSINHVAVLTELMKEYNLVILLVEPDHVLFRTIQQAKHRDSQKHGLSDADSRRYEARSTYSNVATTTLLENARFTALCETVYALHYAQRSDLILPDLQIGSKFTLLSESLRSKMDELLLVMSKYSPKFFVIENISEGAPSVIHGWHCDNDGVKNEAFPSFKFSSNLKVARGLPT